MKRAPSMPVHCEKFLSKTYHMTLEVQGALFRLMMVTWMNNGQALVDDAEDMARYLTCTKDRWLTKIRPKLAPLFDLSDGTWRLTKPVDMMAEWEYVQHSIKVKTENGRLGGRPSSRNRAEDLPNFPAVNAPEFLATQTAKSLENNGTDKAIGSVSVNLDETTIPYTETEVSKKDSPLKPPLPGGTGQGEVSPVQEQAAAPPPPPPRPPAPDTRPAPSLFPVQPVQLAPGKKPRKGRNQPPPLPEEIVEEFWKLNPPCEDKTRHDKQATRKNLAKAVEAGIDINLLIQCWSNYREERRVKGKWHTEYIIAAQNFVNLDRREWEKHTSPYKPNSSSVTPINRNQTEPVVAVRRGGLTY